MCNFAASMQAPKLHICLDQHFWLSSHRAIFWEEKKCLLLSDLHLGKTGHFRRSGIPVPAEVYKEDLQRLFDLTQHFQPVTIVINGDLFHSRYNIEFELFKKWRSSIEKIEIILVKGNHDILSAEKYEELGISCCSSWEQFPFVFVHDIKDVHPDIQLYPITGHIHPGVRLSGVGKQSLHLPCYYFGATHAILPAYSKFTGTMNVQPKPTDIVFGITPTEVISFTCN